MHSIEFRMVWAAAKLLGPLSKIFQGLKAGTRVYVTMSVKQNLGVDSTIYYSIGLLLENK